MKAVSEKECSFVLDEFKSPSVLSDAALCPQSSARFDLGPSSAALRHFMKTWHPLPQPRHVRAQPSVDGSGRASTVPVAAKRMRCPSGPRACRSASSATLRCSRLACARLNEGRSSRRPWAGGACDFLVFFFSVEAPPTGNVVPGEVYILIFHG